MEKDRLDSVEAEVREVKNEFVEVKTELRVLVKGMERLTAVIEDNIKVNERINHLWENVADLKKEVMIILKSENSCAVHNQKIISNTARIKSLERARNWIAGLIIGGVGLMILKIIVEKVLI